MNVLAELDPAKFGHEEWVALAWARDFAIFRGVVKDPAIVSEFEAIYDERQRRDVLAVVTAMDFANRFMNTATGDYLVPPTERSGKRIIREKALRLYGKESEGA
jgi:hypothetical protein